MYPEVYIDAMRCVRFGVIPFLLFDKGDVKLVCAIIKDRETLDTVLADYPTFLVQTAVTLYGRQEEDEL